MQLLLNYFLFDLYKNNNMVRLNDLLLSCVKYQTGLYWLARFKNKSAVINLVEENVDRYYVYRTYIDGINNEKSEVESK